MSYGICWCNTCAVRPRWAARRLNLGILSDMPRPHCRVCGATRATEYRPWETYCHHKGFQGVPQLRPTSDKVCMRCINDAKAGKLKVCARLLSLCSSSFQHRFLSVTPPV